MEPGVSTWTYSAHRGHPGSKGNPVYKVNPDLKEFLELKGNRASRVSRDCKGSRV
jgi:hypothetical protein